MVMAGLLDTFQTIPPGSGGVPHVDGRHVRDAGDAELRAWGSAPRPVVTALLLSTLVMGLISRTLPQLNILMVGFGLNAMLTFAALSLTIGAAAWVFQDQVEPAMETLLEALPRPCAPNGCRKGREVRACESFRNKKTFPSFGCLISRTVW